MRFIDYGFRVSGSRASGQFSKWQYTTYPEKGIVLVDKSKKVADDRDYRGHYEGPSLVLLRSGQFVRFDEEGEWSNWQEESSYWTNEAKEISDRDAIEQFGFATIINGLVEAFEKAVEKAETKKIQLGSRLTQLTQIEMILKHGKVE